MVPGKTKFLVGRPQLVRDLNAINILHTVRTRGPISRIEIARHLGLSQTSVSRIVARLVEAGFLLEQRASDTTRSVGRQCVPLRLNPDAGYVLAVDIGRKETTVAVANLAGEIVVSRTLESQLSRGRGEVLETVCRRLLALLGMQRINLSQVVGLGVTFPGLALGDRGIIRTFAAERGREWTNFDLCDFFQRKLGVPTYVEGDVRAVTVAEHFIGAGKASQVMVCLCVTDEGPSAGIIHDGVLFRGVTDSAGEVGSTVVGYYFRDNRLYRPLFDTSEGILFDQVVRPSTLALIAEREIKKGWRIGGPEGELSPGEVTVSAIARAAERGDQFCQALLKEFATLIGALCINLINFFNPDLIVLHGEMFWAGTVTIQAIREMVRKHVLELSAQAVKIVASELKQDAYILGGVSLVLRELFVPPKFNKDTFQVPRGIRSLRSADLS